MHVFIVNSAISASGEQIEAKWIKHMFIDSCVFDCKWRVALMICSPPESARLSSGTRTRTRTVSGARATVAHWRMRTKQLTYSTTRLSSDQCVLQRLHPAIPMSDAFLSSFHIKPPRITGEWLQILCFCVHHDIKHTHNDMKPHEWKCTQD